MRQPSFALFLAIVLELHAHYMQYIGDIRRYRQELSLPLSSPFQPAREVPFCIVKKNKRFLRLVPQCACLIDQLEKRAREMQSQTIISEANESEIDAQATEIEHHKTEILGLKK